jgi:nitrogen-specific signal transduction histidine kinase
MNFYEEWVEIDLNPIISFSSNGKITYSNQEAQFLLSRIKQKELFDLTLKHAPKTFGIETTYFDLSLKNYSFYAITVKYENEDEIHMKLYKSAMVKKDSELSTKNTNITNIFTLVDLAISTKKIKSNGKFIKNYDPSIPEFKINASEFIKALNLIYDNFQESEMLTTSVILKIGEYIRLEGKKHSIISVEVFSSTKCSTEKFNYKDENASFIVTKDEDKITIDLPLISE